MNQPNHRQVAEGLLYTHTRLNANTEKTLETASFLYALIELLTERGLVSVGDLDGCKRRMGAAGRAVFQQREA